VCVTIVSTALATCPSIISAVGGLAVAVCCRGVCVSKRDCVAVGSVVVRGHHVYMANVTRIVETCDDGSVGDGIDQSMFDVVGFNCAGVALLV
jgi:hypothetical protein